MAESSSPPGPTLIGIYGPTGSGKSDLAEALAAETGAQLINADAFQVYKDLDIGTAKSEKKDRYLLLDLIEPSQYFGVGQWVKQCLPILRELFSQNRSAILVGGTMYYIRALLDRYSDLYPQPSPALRENLQKRLKMEGLESLVIDLLEADPSARDRLDLSNPARVLRHLERLLMKEDPITIDYPPFRILKLGLDPSDEYLNSKLLARIRSMLDLGWEDEVAKLIARPMGRMEPAMRAIGYQTVADLVQGKLDREDAILQIWSETKKYVKRQRTWIRSERDLILLHEIEDWRASEETRLLHLLGQARSFY